jgi:uncharacterized protein YbjQ (UPF0145 family)
MPSHDAALRPNYASRCTTSNDPVDRATALVSIISLGKRMIITTTPTIENRPVRMILGPVATEVIYGTNFIRDAVGDLIDSTGGRLGTVEKVYAQAREKALSQLREAAQAKGSDAIVGLRLEYQVLGRDNGMAMVAAFGTAVRLGVDEVLEAKRAEYARRDEARWHVIIQGERKGPFSVLQISQLVFEGRLEMEALAEDEKGKMTAVEGILAADEASAP